MQAVQLNFSSPEFAEKYHYHGDDLGVTYDPSGSSFKVWAPTAESVTLITYPTGNDSSGEYHPMQKSTQGTWLLDLPGST